MYKYDYYKERERSKPWKEDHNFSSLIFY